ncbi:MAG: hypothetical protein HY898_24540 [Deltaproteobacteria bacterium]|nr:hypothetical protein [Deltaproteobacteria bacterium]
MADHPSPTQVGLERRLAIASYAVAALFGLLLARAAWLQVVRGSTHTLKASQQRYERVRDLPMRGTVRDVRGSVVASSCLAHDIHVAPAALAPRIEQTLPLLAQVLSIDSEAASELAARVRSLASRTPWQLSRVRRGVEWGPPRDDKGRIKYLPGVVPLPGWVRSYPYGPLASHAIGYLNEVSNQDLARHSDDYRMGEAIGRGGIERAWEPPLRGTPGEHSVRRGPKVLPPGPDQAPVQPVPGRDLDLSLDMELAARIDRAFQSRKLRAGSAVVVDAQTGRIAALYSRPSMDINLFATDVSSETLEALDRDPDRPQIDRALAVAYPPGSIFKPFAALAALAASMDPDKPVECAGSLSIGKRSYRCTTAHGKVTLHDALTESCNIWFFRAAESVSIDDIARIARDFGLGEATGIGLNTEDPGRVPTKAWHQQRDRGRYLLGHTLNASIGQGAVRATPIQIAMAYAALINGGMLYHPEVVWRVRGNGGAIEREVVPALRRRVQVPAEHLKRIREIVLQAHRVEAGAASLSGMMGHGQVAFTRGTSDGEMWYRTRDHGWFVGLMPPSDPRWVVVVLTEHERAKVAREIAAEAAQEIASRKEGVQ